MDQENPEIGYNYRFHKNRNQFQAPCFQSHELLFNKDEKVIVQSNSYISPETPTIT
jgi:hypothetical protein